MHFDTMLLKPSSPVFVGLRQHAIGKKIVESGAIDLGIFDTAAIVRKIEKAGTTRPVGGAASAGAAVKVRRCA
jgi:hypothetical protein